MKLDHTWTSHWFAVRPSLDTPSKLSRTRKSYFCSDHQYKTTTDYHMSDYSTSSSREPLKPVNRSPSPVQSFSQSVIQSAETVAATTTAGSGLKTVTDDVPAPEPKTASPDKEVIDDEFYTRYKKN